MQNHELCTSSNSSFLLHYAVTVLVGVVSGLSIFYLSYLVTDRQKKKDRSSLGVLIISELLEEMRIGLATMKKIKRNLNINYENNPQSRIVVAPGKFLSLPTKSWTGLNTIPTKVLLRIQAVWAPRNSKSIRSDCKNYFEHICVSLNIGIKHADFTATYKNLDHYIEATDGVIKDLEQISECLEHDEKKLFF